MANPLNTSDTATYAAYSIEDHRSANDILDAIETFRQRYEVEPDQIVLHTLTVAPRDLPLEIRRTDALALRHSVYVGREGWDPRGPAVEAPPPPPLAEAAPKVVVPAAQPVSVPKIALPPIRRVTDVFNP